MATRAVTERLIERDEELARLLALHRRAADAAGGVAAVAGPAGVGKSALLTALRAGARGPVLAATGHPLETDLPYGVLRQLLAATAVDEMGPHLRSVLTQTVSDADLPVVAYELLVHVEALARPRRTLICVDDAQWADDVSLTAVHHLARRLDQLHATIVVGVRDEPGRPAPVPLAHLLADPRTERIGLHELTSDGTTAMMANLGAAPDRAFAAAAHEVTGGNPFLVRELVRALDDAGVTPTAEHARTATTLTSDVLRHSVYVRLSRLDASAVDVARWLAISGPAPIETIAKLAGVTSPRVVTVIDALVSVGVMSADAPTTFTHPLIRQAIYDDIPPARRRARHAHVARVLREEGVPPERVAAQLVHAEPSREDWVVDALLQASEEALLGGSASTSAAFATHGLRCAPHSDKRWRLLRTIGRAHYSIQGDAKALAPLAEAAELAPTDSDRADIAIEHARHLAQLQQHDASLDVLDSASRRLAEPAVRMRLRVEYVSHARTHPHLRAQARAELEQLEPPPAGVTRDLYLGVLALDRAETGASAQDAAALARAALASGRLHHAEGFTFTFPLQVLMWCDAVDEVEEHWSRVIEIAEGRGWLLRAAMARHLRRIARWRRGDLSGAAADWDAVAQWAPLYESTPMRRRTLSDAALVALDRGCVDEARQLAVKAMQAPDDGGSDYAIGRIALAFGDLTEAASRLGSAGRFFTEIGGADCPGFLDWRSQLALAYAGLGETQRAWSLVAEELALAERFGAPRALGIAARVAGQLSDGDAARELLQRSVAVLDESVAAVELATSLLALGRHLRRTTKSVALDPLRRALDVAERFGARTLADDAYAELVTAGARPRRRQLVGVDALTPAQRRVAELAAEGLNNRQIAQRLFVTIRTVTTHLTAVYQKLGIEGREELAETLHA